MKKIFATLLVLTFIFTALAGAASKPEDFVLKGDGAAETVHIIYPDDCNDLIKQYAEVFAERLSEITGAKIEAHNSASMLSSAIIPRIFIGEEYDNHLYVESLKSQNGGLLPFMPASEEEWDKYCGTSSMFSMWLDNDGFHINASDEWALYCAIDDFLNELEISDSHSLSTDKKVFTDDDYTFPDPTELIGNGMNPYFAVTEKVAELPSFWNDYNILDYSESMQGGGTDGEYAYIASDGSGDLGRIFKYTLPEWELIDLSEPIVIKHGNDISYIEESDLLTIAHCVDGDQGFSYVDPDTFEIVGVSSVPVNCWGLEYDDVNEKFVVEADWINYIFDKDFNLVSEIHYGDSDGTPQSLYIEGDYIFDVRWDMNWLRYSGVPFKYCDFQNYIMIHDYENAYVERAYIPEVSGEPEFIFRYENSYYIGFLHNVVNNIENPLGVIYKFVMLPEIWWN